MQEVGQSALFGARFRENAARALLIPRRRPGAANAALAAAAEGAVACSRSPDATGRSRSSSRPTANACRTSSTCPRSSGCCTACARASSTSSTSRRATASPYAASLLFDYIATYMYEDDTPPAERRAQALSLDRDLLRELLGQEELRDLLDPGALDEVEAQLRGDAAQRRPAARPAPPARRPPRGRVRRGICADAAARAPRSAREGCGEERLIAAEDAGRYRDALGVMPPGGLPEVFLEAGAAPLDQLVLRFARGRGPFTTAQANERFGRDVEQLLHDLERASCSCAANSVRAAPSASGATPTCCAGFGVRHWPHSGSEVEPAEQASLGRFLPGWHGIDRRADAPRGARPAAGTVASRVALGVGGAAAPRPGLPAGPARPALRLRRGRLGRRRPRPRRDLLPRGCSGARRSGGRAAAGGRGARHDPRGARAAAPSSGSTCSPRPASRPRSRCRRCGSSSGRER